MHGGSIAVESEIGRGSRFTVSMPWQLSTDKQAELQSDTILQNGYSVPKVLQRQSKPLVLLAEDNEANIQMIFDYLTVTNHQVLVARNGIEAIKQAQEKQPDIILMDIQMPEMDGLEAIRQLRTDPRLASTPIIALTALAMPGDKERCLAAGATDYMSKPIGLKQLTEVIKAQCTSS